MTCLSSAAEMCPSLFLSKTFYISLSRQGGKVWGYFESLSDLFLGICVVHLPSHEGHELSEIDRVGSICVNLIISISSGGLKGEVGGDSSGGGGVDGLRRRYSITRKGGHGKRLTSLIISSSSAWVGFCPKDLITVPSSLAVIVPSPSTSISPSPTVYGWCTYLCRKGRMPL